MAMQGYRIAVDIGGTFTDGVVELLPEGQVLLAKRLTTPDDPSRAVAEVVSDLLEQLAQNFSALVPAEDCREVVHGTTLVANAIIERKGVKVALFVTSGTADVIDIGRETRYDLYDLDIEMPVPLVPRELRFEIDERLNARGQVLRPLAMNGLDDGLAQAETQGVGAIAICLLHAYVNGSHEEALATAIRSRMPEVAISLSSRVASEVREYERMSTTVANAYVQPIAANYIALLKERLEAHRISAPLRVMVSSGGFTSDQAAAEVPIVLLESGPAGGVRSAVNTASQLGIDDILTFDMGGTTAKACVSTAGAPSITYAFEAARVKRFKRGSGLPILSPSIDLIEIGAGGGSIAYRNELGLLNVGPASAGAEPGPACYGQGGLQPTVTDADLMLGYLDPDAFLGGKMRLDRASAEAALTTLAGDLGISVQKTAWGIHDVVNENMAGAARVHIAEKGLDPRRLAMVATGGAGPVHAIEVAQKLGIRRILFTIAAGVGSCLGFLAAPARVDRSWSSVQLLDMVDLEDVRTVFERLEDDIKTELGTADAAATASEWSIGIEMRYAGQGATILVTLPYSGIDKTILAELEASFLGRYEDLYGTTVPGATIQVVTWRLAAQSKAETRVFSLATAAGSDESLEAARRQIYLPAGDGYENVPVYERYQIPEGAELAGPLILQEAESTIVVARPAQVTVLEGGAVSVVLD